VILYGVYFIPFRPKLRRKTILNLSKSHLDKAKGGDLVVRRTLKPRGKRSS